MKERLLIDLFEKFCQQPHLISLLMGFVFSKLFTRLFKSKQEFKIIIVGLHNAGKTTILYKLALGEVIVTSPTIGSNVEEVN